MRRSDHRRGPSTSNDRSGPATLDRLIPISSVLSGEEQESADDHNRPRWLQRGQLREDRIGKLRCPGASREVAGSWSDGAIEVGVSPLHSSTIVSCGPCYAGWLASGAPLPRRVGGGRGRGGNAGRSAAAAPWEEASVPVPDGKLVAGPIEFFSWRDSARGCAVATATLQFGPNAAATCGMAAPPASPTRRRPAPRHRARAVLSRPVAAMR